jgi:rare lipoprotein A
LSYTAAQKLDMVRNGTAFVEVRSLESMPADTPLSAANDDRAGAAGTVAPEPPPVAAPAAPGTPTPAGIAPPTAAANAPLFIQAGAFSDPQNAKRLQEKLAQGDYGKIFVRDDEIAGRRMYRVRIGPIKSVAEFDRIIAALDRDGIRDAHLALE